MFSSDLMTRKPRRRLKRRRSVDDVAATTSLPPLVSGNLYGFLRMTVSKLIWTAAYNLHHPVAVLVKWWGQPNEASVFRPHSSRDRVSKSSSQTTARFPIKSPFEHLSNYFKDMDTLILDVVDAMSKKSIGRVSIPELSLLSPTKPISGFYPIFDEKGQRLGEIKVSLKILGLPKDGKARPDSASSSVSTSTDFSDAPRLNEAPIAANMVPQRADNVQDLKLPVVMPVFEQENVSESNSHKPDDQVLIDKLINTGQQLKHTLDDISNRNKPISYNVGEPTERRQITFSPSATRRPVLQNYSHERETELVAMLLPEVHQFDPLDNSLALPELDGEYSDLGDPLHDDDIISDLFYNKSDSDDMIEAPHKEPQRLNKKKSVVNQVKQPSIESDKEAENLESENNLRSFSRSSSISSIHGEPFPLFKEKTADISIASSSASTRGLGVQRLTLLGRVSATRVTITSLHLPEPKFPKPNESVIKRRARRRQDKPPKPTRSTTYFVEYHFPVTAGLSTKKEQVSEVTRLASRKVKNNTVLFDNRSVFSTDFDQHTIENWWSSYLTFKVFSRTVGEKKPKTIGKASIPLRSVLQSDGLSLSRTLLVRPVDQLDLEGLNDAELPKLWIAVALISGDNEFQTAVTKTAEAEAMKPTKIVPIEAAKKIFDLDKPKTISVPVRQHHPPKQPTTMKKPTDTALPTSAVLSNPALVGQSRDQTMFVLLMVTRGHIFPTSQGRPRRNTYLVCRMFDRKETVRSSVAWGATEPLYNLVQVSPILLTPATLDRLANNFMVCEVWEKNAGKVPGTNDELIGIVKLPTHSFYSSYHDPTLSSALSCSQYPIIAVDGHLPISSPYLGRSEGELSVCLALGTYDQVNRLRCVKCGIEFSQPQDNTALNNLTLPSSTDDNSVSRIQPIKHVFEINVTAVRDVSPPSETHWSEADCFVQYHFPTTSRDERSVSALTMKPYRTATALCAKDVQLIDMHRHNIVLPSETPVQQELLSACVAFGKNSAQIPFELWIRQYMPNTRDCLVAVARLPLSKLCAMITMTSGSTAWPAVQAFSLPLNVASLEVERNDLEMPCGSMEVTISYSATIPPSVALEHQKQADSLPPVLSVAVHRACGLQFAAQLLSNTDRNLIYPAKVGVNAFVVMKLSTSTGKQIERTTRTVARCFTPEFNYQFEFTLPSTSGGNYTALLESSCLSFEVWHQVVKPEGSKLTDILLGSFALSLKKLFRQTDVRGWYPIYAACEERRLDDLQTLSAHSTLFAGGLEIELSCSDSPALISEPVGSHLIDDNLKLSFYLGNLLLPLSILTPTPQRTPSIYIRYKLYRERPVCSDSIRTSSCSESPDGILKVPIEERFSSVLRLNESALSTSASTSKMPLTSASRDYMLDGWSTNFRYLNRERLEMQIWQSGDQEAGYDDVLISSAFVDLSDIIYSSQTQGKIRERLPVFRAGAKNLFGAYLNAEVDWSILTKLSNYDETADLVDFADQIVRRRQRDRPKSGRSPKKPDTVVSSESNQLTTNSLPVTLMIEEARHLEAYVRDTGEGKTSTLPSSYVTIPTFDETDSRPAYTKLVRDTETPRWNHQQTLHLPNDLLFSGKETLILKVWHRKPDDHFKACLDDSDPADIVIGYVSVDLKPLVAGLHSLNGWYNILDFSGRTRGQLKLSIIPHRRCSPNKSVNLPPSQLLVAPQTSSYESTSAALHPPHFWQHFECVKLYHQALSANETAGNETSILRACLRANLKELDDLTLNLKRRLTLDSSHDKTSQSINSTPSTGNSYAPVLTSCTCGRNSCSHSGLANNSAPTSYTPTCHCASNYSQAHGVPSVLYSAQDDQHTHTCQHHCQSCEQHCSSPHITETLPTTVSNLQPSLPSYTVYSTAHGSLGSSMNHTTAAVACNVPSTSVDVLHTCMSGVTTHTTTSCQQPQTSVHFCCTGTPTSTMDPIYSSAIHVHQPQAVPSNQLKLGHASSRNSVQDSASHFHNTEPQASSLAMVISTVTYEPDRVQNSMDQNLTPHVCVSASPSIVSTVSSATANERPVPAHSSSLISSDVHTTQQSQPIITSCVRPQVFLPEAKHLTGQVESKDDYSDNDKSAEVLRPESLFDNDKSLDPSNFADQREVILRSESPLKSERISEDSSVEISQPIGESDVQKPMTEDDHYSWSVEDIVDLLSEHNYPKESTNTHSLPGQSEDFTEQPWAVCHSGSTDSINGTAKTAPVDYSVSPQCQENVSVPPFSINSNVSAIVGKERINYPVSPRCQEYVPIPSLQSNINGNVSAIVGKEIVKSPVDDVLSDEAPSDHCVTDDPAREIEIPVLSAENSVDLDKPSVSSAGSGEEAQVQRRESSTGSVNNQRREDRPNDLASLSPTDRALVENYINRRSGGSGKSPLLHFFPNIEALEMSMRNVSVQSKTESALSGKASTASSTKSNLTLTDLPSVSERRRIERIFFQTAQ